MRAYTVEMEIMVTDIIGLKLKSELHGKFSITVICIRCHITVITKTAIIGVNFENYKKIKLIATILLEK